MAGEKYARTMGTWGVGVFCSDQAADIRAAWRDGLLEGAAPEEVEAQLMLKHVSLTPEDDAVFWIALAAAQHETGRLRDEACRRALAVIDGGVDDEWGSLATQRRRSLERLRSKLTGPQPPPKRLRRRRSHGVTFGLGDVVALREADGTIGRVVAVAALEPQRPGSAGEPDPLVVFLEWDGRLDLATLDVARLPALWWVRRHDGVLIAHCACVTTPRRADVFSEHVGVVLGGGIHPYRLPPRRTVAGPAIVQWATTWPELAVDSAAHRVPRSNEHISVHDELAAIAAEAGRIAREDGIDDRLPHDTPAVFQPLGEQYAMLRYYLGSRRVRDVAVAGDELLRLDERQWQWIASYSETIRASLIPLRRRYYEAQRRLSDIGWS
jgi:hypothetical protein